MKLRYFIIISVSCVVNLIFIDALKIKCPWKTVLGIDCAGCGATRMLEAVLNLDFYQAFRYNPLIFSFIILGILYLIYVSICMILKKKYFTFGFKSLMMVLVILIIFMVLRNIEIFQFLKPTIIR